MTAPFRLRLKILFQHCDPAGIVFYPRYFEMVNQVVETWFDDALGFPFAMMQLGNATGVPAVSIEASFLAPSRLGDVLDWSLTVEKLGRTSASLRVAADAADAEGEQRLRCRIVIVHVRNDTGRPTVWPDDLRNNMDGFGPNSA